MEQIISGQAGLWAVPLRAVLRVAEVPYSWAVARRNARFDRERPEQANVPVISVGNITVGGTGKTPFVIELVRRLTDMGRKPAVVARGYKASKEGANDEELLIRRRCPHVIYVADADRHRGAEEAVRRGADVIVLDDGFQHRRLARDLDLVLIDATCPFGYGHMLPRGLLREPAASLKRANGVVITRADQVDAAQLAEIRSTIHAVSKPVPVLECEHRVMEASTLAGERLEVQGLAVMLIAGIARPAAFEATVRGLGADVVHARWWPDHHRYSERELQDVLVDFQRSEAELVLTTEKDAVKIERLLLGRGNTGGQAASGTRRHSHESRPIPASLAITAKGAYGRDRMRGLASVVGVVKVGVDFMGDGSTMVRELLEQAISMSEK